MPLTPIVMVPSDAPKAKGFSADTRAKPSVFTGGRLEGHRLALACVLCVGIAACFNAPSSTESEDFFRKVEQTADERVVVSTLAALDSFALSDYDVFNAQHIEVDEHWIYAADGRLGKVLAVDKEDVGSYRFIGHGLGEGPGEIAALRDFDVSDGHLVLANRQHRLARFTTEGTFVGEQIIDHEPRQLEIMEDGKVLTYDNTYGENLFMVIDVEGTVVHGMGIVRNAVEELGAGWLLRSSGFVDYYGGHIYYTGYSESLIKKYALDGTLVFSVATIDNHPSEINYTETVGESSRIIGYAPTALYASLNIAVYGRYFLIRPAINADYVVLRYLDVYDNATGEYIRSYRVAHAPIDFALDDEHLFMLQADRNLETGESDRYIKIYDNVLRDG